MALARLALRNLPQRVCDAAPSASFVGYGNNTRIIRCAENKSWSNEILKRFATAVSSDDKSEGTEVAVSEDKKSGPFPRRQRRNWLWRNKDRDFVPALDDFLPSGLGNALMEATENINRLFENMNLIPSSLIGRMKEKDDHYKLWFDMPGLAKDEVKITVDDGVLRIKGKHKDEQEEGDDGKYWSSRSYGYYDTSLVLPEDAKPGEIKAELKHGVLSIVIPRTEKPKQDVQEIKID